MRIAQNSNDPNLALVALAATLLGELCERLVFVGGCAAGLLITDNAQPSIRATQDVDVIVQVAALTEYHAVEQALAERGFKRNMQDDVICRWHHGALMLDLMPTENVILGFSNRWYSVAAQTAQIVSLPTGQTIRLISAPLFIATKLEAFDGRGGGDYLYSHDLEDVIAVIDGRDELPDEVVQARADVASYLALRFTGLLQTQAFVDALPGHLPGDTASQARLPDLLEKLKIIASVKTQ